MTGPETTDNAMHLNHKLLVELTATPAEEHLDKHGVALRVEFLYDESGCRAAKYWKSETHAMQWLEQDTSLLMGAESATPLSLEIAAPLLAAIRSVAIDPLVESSHVYMHAATFQLTILSLGSSCKFSWSSKLPPEWRSLQDPVEVLLSIGSDSGHPCSASITAEDPSKLS